MVFSSMVFLFLFLPIVCVGYFIIPNRTWKNCFLTIASLFFYAWGEPIYVLLMIFSILINYLVALGIGTKNIQANTNVGKDICDGKDISSLNDIKVGNDINIINEEIPLTQKSTVRRVFFLVLGIIINLGLLIYFKYAGFYVESINNLFHTKFPVPNVILPIGISFFTFQSLSYVIDVYREKTEVQKNIIKIALYISLFPQLIAGPIVRYTDIEKEISSRKETLPNFIDGLKQVMFGLGAKVIIANNMAIIADTIYNSVDGSNSVPTLMLWIAALAYTFQIYFDFSGYSRMAIGLGKMFGFTFPENFNYPYVSKSITEFWRRWHISLSTWFRDYVYIPLGGNRCPWYRHIFNIMFTWLLTGLWHGASWNFVLWGLYYGLLLLFEKYVIFRTTKQAANKSAVKGSNYLTSILSRCYALFFIVIGWVLFRIEDFTSLGIVLFNMFGGIISGTAETIGTMTNVDFFLANTSAMSKIVFFPLAIIASTPVFTIFFNKFRGKTLGYTLELLSALIIYGLSLAMLIASTYNPFIYFRF